MSEKTEKKRSRIKSFLYAFTAAVLILLSITVAAYPFISDYVNSLNNRQEIVQYLDYIAEPPANKYEEILERAREYNKSLLFETSEFADPFTEYVAESANYLSQLSIPDTDVMATLYIPKINVSLPVYHGTSAEVLSRGVGHLSVSSLPVGGTGTHAVLSAHTGYSGQRLFSDLDRLEIGDVFYINCLGEELAYKVDKISIVLPDDTSLLQIDPYEDYVTLITCTPFGVNTHRLLVRGTRIELSEAEEIEASTQTASSTWNEEYIKAILLGLAVMGFVLLIYLFVRFILYLIKRKKGDSR